MDLIELFVGLLLCAVALAILARRIHVPYPVALVLGGGALGFLPELPKITLQPDLVLTVFLPPVLYQAAITTSWRDFKHWGWSIGTLATGLVLATTVCVGAVLRWLVPDTPWPAAVAFGAIVSAPDAVAATAILGRLNMPRRLTAVLEGESLVNDASALVLYKFAVAAAVTGAFSWTEATADFVWIVIAGIAGGFLLARGYVEVLRRLNDPFVATLLAITLPYVAYLGAEKIGASGVLAVVTAGLVRARYAPEVLSPDVRLLLLDMWNTIVFLFNTLIFILIGLQLRPMLESLDEHGAWQIAGYALAVTATAVAVRLVWVFPGGWLARWVTQWRQRTEPPPDWRGALIGGWCGMRGIVSMAAALALPHTLANGAPFPERHLLIVLTFAFLALTLVLQGLTLAPLVRWLKIPADMGLGEEEVLARTGMAHAALSEIDRQGAAQSYPEQYVAFLRYLYETRLDHLKPAEQLAATPEFFVRISALRLAALDAERRELIQLWRTNRIGDEVLHRLEVELDLEATRIALTVKGE
jgi:CPA1 family monovalent cation:H+ antiporter